MAPLSLSRASSVTAFVRSALYRTISSPCFGHKLSLPASQKLASGIWTRSPITSRRWRHDREQQTERYVNLRPYGTVHNEHPTTSDAFFEALWEGGVQACFVNLGSDHPSLIEAMLKGQEQRPHQFPKIYTCPNEMVALSMADGWARFTGQPQAVIVHVDVGTQALGAGMHNANAGRVPVLIFAGLCPYSESGDLPGQRTEYQHWLQDIPDQKAIVRQYCRYTGEIRSAGTVKETVTRAMQFSTSDPKGPVYLVGAREVMAEKVPQPSTLSGPRSFSAIGPAALPDSAVAIISESLSQAKSPLVITGYSGRNHACPRQLVRLADLLPSLHVLDTGGSDMCFPFSHPASLGFRLGMHPAISAADVILVLDCDVPWIPSRSPPNANARIYHIDVDPLNERIDRSFFPAHGRWRADAETALAQLNNHLTDFLSASGLTSHDEMLWQQRADQHATRLKELAELARPPSPSSRCVSAHHVGAALRATLPADTVYIMEAATNVPALADQLAVSQPGSWINSSGAGLGWSGGAALGVKLALQASGMGDRFVCQVAGDGVFMFSVPSSVYWTASRYGVPVLTVVLNNKGWHSPRRSLELMPHSRRAAQASNKDMHLSFDPAPDYGGIAKAAAGERFGMTRGGLFTGKASTVDELQHVLNRAAAALKEERGAVVEVLLQEE